MSEYLPYSGAVIQVDPEYSKNGINAALMIVKEVNHEKDVVVACLVHAIEGKSVQAWYEIPISEVEIIGTAFWAPEEISLDV